MTGVRPGPGGRRFLAVGGKRSPGRRRRDGVASPNYGLGGAAARPTPLHLLSMRMGLGSPAAVPGAGGERPPPRAAAPGRCPRPGGGGTAAGRREGPGAGHGEQPRSRHRQQGGEPEPRQGGRSGRTVPVPAGEGPGYGGRPTRSSGAEPWRSPSGRPPGRALRPGGPAYAPSRLVRPRPGRPLRHRVTRRARGSRRSPHGGANARRDRPHVSEARVHRPTAFGPWASVGASRGQRLPGSAARRESRAGGPKRRTGEQKPQNAPGRLSRERGAEPGPAPPMPPTDTTCEACPRCPFWSIKGR
jgi:translation initiation factor IF-2